MIKKIDKLTRVDHYYLEKGDTCYYFGEYTSGVGYTHSPTNSLISNFKKPIDAKGTPQWKYKIRAIKEVAELFLENIKFRTPENILLAPIPPSKSQDHKDFDDRMSHVLRIFNEKKGLDLRELLTVTESIESFHIREERPSPTELKNILKLEPLHCKNMKPTVVLFDDLITTGCHFKACKELILDSFPGTKVIGVFIARRSFNASNDFR